jgi:hypothetical protein
MTVPFNRFMSQLLQAIFDGFAAFEQVYWMPETGPLKGKITLKKLAYRPSETVTFITDETGGFAGSASARSGQRQVDRQVHPARPLLLLRGPGGGAQVLRRLLLPERVLPLRQEDEALLHRSPRRAARRGGNSSRHGPEQRDQIDRSKFAESLSNLSVAQYMMCRRASRSRACERAARFDFLNFINHHNSQMSKSILATFFDEDKGGGSADSKMINFGGSGMTCSS